MLSASYLKLFFALSIFFISLAAGWYPFKKRRQGEHHHDLPIGETLATGVFLGAAFMHLLPESNALFVEAGFHYPLAFIITGGVFLFFLWFEHVGQELYRHRDDKHPYFALTAWLMLSIHSIMIGTALGFSQHQSLMIMLFLAVITHKWAESFAIAIQLNKTSLSHRNCFLLFILFCLMTPLGMLFGSYSHVSVEQHSLFAPILMAASAGTFLYLGTLHGLDRCVMLKRCCNLRDFSFVIIGFLLMAGVAEYV